ncbi:MAG: TonB-dependent receptor [Acidobacteria bacterium]|nr:TonB-dependent receptor [Acidobacteriota bacterium]MBS1865405.1 TonB-dependent receptor [Acidobacteriota bacterium]
MGRRQCVCVWMLLVVMILVSAGIAAAQNTASLSGTVMDPQGLAVRGAKITLTSNATGAERGITSNDDGHYTFVGLSPGTYKMTVDGGANFALYINESLTVSVGENATFDVRLELRIVVQTVTVTSQTAHIETSKTEVSDTIRQNQINSLPINGRNYINFTLLDSKTTRDVSPTIGPAPNSGLNISGARARSNQVTVDGADAVDNSVNGIRATVSQEAVQEFQLILSNYNAEYGRATGGVINIVTKSGGNEFHGDAFGFFRNKAFQARNAFSGQVDPATGNLVPTKQGFTRVQTGMTLGGPIRKDKTFIFGSYEYTQREETGFSSIGVGNFGLTTGLVPCIPVPLSLTSGPTGQLAFYQAALGALTGNGAACTNANPAIQAQISGLSQAAVVTGASSNVALNADMNINADGSVVPISSVLGIPGAFGSKFFPAPVNCPLGTQVNNVVCLPVGPNVGSGVGTGLVPLPASYVGLNSLRGNFPATEKTSLWSARLDQNWNSNNHSFLRVGVSPSLVSGIQSTSQNQVFGQNAGTRVGLNQVRDLNITFQHDTVVDPTIVNQARFQFARRGLHFGFSPLPGGDQIGVNIPGFAYFGREPYSTVDRIERRFQFTDVIDKTKGKHEFKFGGDFNLIQLRSAKQQIFELDFGGDVNFGSISPFGSALPATNGAQSYGLGVPTTYIQGIGNSNQPFDNIPIGFFAQDTWKMTKKLTVNYGVRYDVEITPLFAPATAVNAAAEKALGVVEGIPRDYNNISPRLGIAWDPKGNGKTVVRVGYGLFYDHPLLAVAFDSVTADGGRSVQLLSAGGTPSACGILSAPAPATCGTKFDTPANLNGSSIFQGALNANSIYPAFPTSLTLGYLPNEQRFDPFAAGSLFANQNYLNAGFPLPILPFTLPVGANFKFGYAQQGNLTIEREIAGSWKMSVGYQYTRGIHLNRPVDINSTDPQLLANNALNAAAAGISFSNPVTVVAPSASFGPNTNGPNTCGVSVIAPQTLGVLFGCPIASLNGQFVGTPAFFNFFRPSGPNPSFAAAAGGYANQVALAHLAHYPLGFGIPVPFNSVDAQLSDASSWYHALTVNVEKRMSKGLELFSSYTWSHSIDDGTDLQSTLEPQDSRFPFLERGNSVNDQRHRWVTSAVFTTDSAKGGDSAWKHAFGAITLSPIIEVASGRPFNVITGTDTRLDLGASQARPSVVTSGGTTSPFIPGVQFGVADVCLTNSGSPFTVPGVAPPGGCNGNLGRNAFRGPGFLQIDLRISKAIPLGEKLKLNLIADGFNLLNRTNVAAVNQLCDPSAGATCLAGQPTAAYDARQFQFALKLVW